MDSRLSNKQWRIDHLYKLRTKQNELVPFQRNAAQRHFNENKWYRNLILKSRQLGFTTDEAIDSLDDTLFKRNTDVLLIAHNLDAGKKIFGDKIELAWKNLPDEIRNLYGVDTKTAQTLKFDFGDGSFSSMAVDTSGRSGTYHRVHVTEFAEICKKYPEKAREIIEGTIPAVPTTGRIDFESTSQGASGEFYEMFIEAYERGEPTHPVEFKAHFYNWTWDHDELRTIAPVPVPKDFKDYQKHHKLTDVQITYYYLKWLSLRKNWNSLRREYPTTPEEAFDAITEGTFYGPIIADMERNGQITTVPYDRALPVHTVWDLGIGRNLVIGFYQFDSLILKKIDYWQGDGSDGMPEGIKAVRDKPYIFGRHFAPHDIKSTDVSTGKTRLDAAKELLFEFTVIPDHSVDDRINAAQLTLSHTFVDKEKNKEWTRAMKNYSRKWDDKRGMYMDEPYHNWASHGADEYGYAAISEDKMKSDYSSIHIHRPKAPRGFAINR
jgi:hypothetical protein